MVQGKKGRKIKFAKEKYRRHYIQGFVDAEGCFSVSLKKVPTARFGWTIDPVFHVTQHKKNRAVLEMIRDVLGCGRIAEKHGQRDCLIYVVDNRRQLLEKVVRFFERYPLLAKARDFEKFKKIVVGLEQKEHWTREGFKNLARLAFEMNSLGKQRRYKMERIFRDVVEGADSSETTSQASASWMSNP